MFAVALWIWLETHICVKERSEIGPKKSKRDILSASGFFLLCKKSLYIIKADLCLKPIYETFVSAPEKLYSVSF